jgi:hypothetical protein
MKTEFGKEKKIIQHRQSMRHYDTSRKVDGSIRNAITGFLIWHNACSRTMVPELTQPLTRMNFRNLPEGKGRAARKSDNLTATCEPNAEC